MSRVVTRSLQKQIDQGNTQNVVVCSSDTLRTVYPLIGSP